MQQLAVLMKRPENIAISEYHYDLPEEKIARFPLQQRDASRLLIYEQKVISEDIYRNIASHLPSEALLVFNNTKVIQARILFQKATGALIEIFCLEPHESYPDITTGMSQMGTVLWKCLVGGASKWKKGMVLEKEMGVVPTQFVLRAKCLEKRDDCFVVELSWEPAQYTFAEVLQQAGLIPLPPYLKREAVAEDTQRYQTIYALLQGSVAAPTAGLHFSEQIFDNLKARNIKTEYVTLHVGAGTFKPVSSQRLSQHEMHEEFIQISFFAIENILNNLGRGIIAVGTTSLRTLESLYWLGTKLIASPDLKSHELMLGQWDPYEYKGAVVEPAMALEAVVDWMKIHNQNNLIARTKILIAPGYHFKIISGLITNFHQPQSTLLLLIAALIGEDWKKIYAYALRNDFRFLSYGDGCLLFRADL